VGEFDIPDVHAHCGAIEAGIPGSQREVAKGDGHLIQLEDPQGFTQRLTRFVNLQNRAAVTVPPETLRLYAGKYTVGPAVVNIHFEGDHLEFQLSDDGLRYPLFANSPSKFFLRTAYVEVEFIKDSAGKVTEMIANDDGTIYKCRRM